GTLNIIQCTINNNSADYGGGGYNGSGCTLNITNCTISSNSTPGGTGYGFLYDDGNVNIINTTLYNNLEYSSIYRRNGTVIITNTLIAGAVNSSSNAGSINSGGYNIIGYNAGGTFNQSTGDIVGTIGSPASIGINTSLTNNGGPTNTYALLISSNGVDAGTSSGAPYRYRRNCTVIITNTLIAGAVNSSSNAGSINSGGYNIIGYNAGGTFNQSTGDIVGTIGSPASIGINTSLTNNGGPTNTYALLISSNGVDAGTSSGAPYRDQRGYLRSSIDRGAFEYNGTPSSAPTNINLSNNSVIEDSSTGTIVGTLSPTDSDSNETYTYVLVPGTGSTDNDSFYIDGNLLKTNAVFDYETKNSYSIRIWVDDGISTYEKQMTISVTEANETLFIIHPSSTQNQSQEVSIP
ncbi:hypothetical protein MHK_008152, partial [Candidatus Magnetomorum sp. HK-1]